MYNAFHQLLVTFVRSKDGTQQLCHRILEVHLERIQVPAFEAIGSSEPAGFLLSSRLHFQHTAIPNRLNGQHNYFG